jgi:stage IV sporulation protein FB
MDAQEPVIPLQEDDENERQAALDYPPKYRPLQQKNNSLLRSIQSLALYLMIGYLIFPSFTILVMVTAIVLIHELGHFLAMKYFKYSDLGMFFIPLLGAYVSGTKREVSQTQSAIILLAGPLPGVFIGCALYFIDAAYGGLIFWGISVYTISLLFIFLNLFNLLPIYPLDGGQLLNRVFLDEEGYISRVFIYLSIAAMIWFSISLWQKTGSWFYFVLLLFPIYLLLRMRSDSQLTSLEKKLEEDGYDLNMLYEDMTDQQYWELRKKVIANHKAFSDIAPGPPYEYDTREDKLMNAIQSLLHRTFWEDMTIPGKIVLLVIWVAALASPCLLQLDLSFFTRFR